MGLTLNMYFASLRYTSPTFVASTVNTIASLTFVIAVVLRYRITLWRAKSWYSYKIFNYLHHVMQVGSSWSSKSSWDGKSSWDFDLFSWCNDHDILQRIYHEKSVAPSSLYSRTNFHPRELVKGFCSSYYKLHNMVYMVHHAGFFPNLNQTINSNSSRKKIHLQNSKKL